MASELRVNTLKDASGNNSIATSVVFNGSAKVWINFNGTGTIAARDSYNVSSLTDNGTGQYTPAYSNNMSNDDYCATGTADDPGTAVGVEHIPHTAASNKTSAQNMAGCTNTSGGSTDMSDYSYLVHGDLA